MEVESTKHDNKASKKKKKTTKRKKKKHTLTLQYS